jgi:antitoxin MazE
MYIHCIYTGGIEMVSKVQKWGNSLGLRIPKPLAEELGLLANSPVELSLVDGKLIISPIIKQIYSLEELISQVNEENLHYEIDTGPAEGGEVW